MHYSRPSFFIAVALAALVPLGGAPAAETCFRNIGTKSRFGSDEQVQTLQALAKGKCPIVGFTFKLSQPTRSTLVVADLEKGEMLRLKIDPTNRPWEMWTGFTRDEVLEDDPSDGFDLGKFTSSSSGASPAVPDRISAFVKTNKMQGFLP